MIELPEAVVLAHQINATVAGKRIVRAVANASPHKFAWYTGDPTAYNDLLAGKTIGRASGVGAMVEIEVEDRVLAIGAPIRYHEQREPRPANHQLLLGLAGGTALSATAQMWGGFFCFPRGEKSGSIEYDCAKDRPSPLDDAFDRPYSTRSSTKGPRDYRRRRSSALSSGSPGSGTASSRTSCGRRAFTRSARQGRSPTRRSTPCSGQ